MKRELLTFPQIRNFLALLVICFSQIISACAARPTPISHPATPESPQAIDINTASSEDLERLPGIGAKTAEKIIVHREKFGMFRRKEHLLLVDGISEKKFRAISALISVRKRPG